MQTVQFFKALSDPTRLKLVYMLRDDNCRCVCDLTVALEQPQPTISRHLNHLKRLGIVTAERRGTWVWYALNTAMPNWCQQIIAHIEYDSEIASVKVTENNTNNSKSSRQCH